jgi:hypothetical protein
MRPGAGNGCSVRFDALDGIPANFDLPGENVAY